MFVFMLGIEVRSSSGKVPCQSIIDPEKTYEYLDHHPILNLNTRVSRRDTRENTMPRTSRQPNNSSEGYSAPSSSRAGSQPRAATRPEPESSPAPNDEAQRIRSAGAEASAAAVHEEEKQEHKGEDKVDGDYTTSCVVPACHRHCRRDETDIYSWSRAESELRKTAASEGRDVSEVKHRWLVRKRCPWVFRERAAPAKGGGGGGRGSGNRRLGGRGYDRRGLGLGGAGRRGPAGRDGAVTSYPLAMRPVGLSTK